VRWIRDGFEPRYCRPEPEEVSRGVSDALGFVGVLRGDHQVLWNLGRRVWAQSFTNLSQADRPLSGGAPVAAQGTGAGRTLNIFVDRSCIARRRRPWSTSCRELRRGGESILSPVPPPSRELPHARDLLDSIMVPHRPRVIPGCRQMGGHIPPVAPPAVVHRTQNVKRRQRAVDETRQRVQLRRFASFRSHH
jgi:hypothetical protein